jgi:isopentenyldiphosphate isomerase
MIKLYYLKFKGGLYMEIWDVYDRDRNLTGKKILRGEPNVLKEGEYELVVHVAIFNSEGEMLIQKRQSTKEQFPNLWDISAGGHSIQGETSEEAIAREVYEELGYSRHNFLNERPYFTINYPGGFDDVYVVIDDGLDINHLRLQKDEVQSVTWATKEEILQLIEENKFIPYCPGFIELLFFNKNKRGLTDV